MLEKESLINNKQTVMNSLPKFGLTFLLVPIHIVPVICAKYFGLDLVLVWARVFDAIIDPLVGYWSDCCRTRSDSRKLIVVISGSLTIVGCYLLYVPLVTWIPHGCTTFSIGYFIACFLWFFLAQTIFEIPRMSWGRELTQDRNQKWTLFGWRSFFIYFGQVLFSLVPFLPLFGSRRFSAN